MFTEISICGIKKFPSLSANIKKTLILSKKCLKIGVFLYFN